MPTLFVFTEHSPENCAVNNEKVKKAVLEFSSKAPPLRKKHGIKSVGSWTFEPEHQTISIVEVPSVDAWLKYGMEPEVMKYAALQTRNYFKVGMAWEEFGKLLK